MRIIFVIVLALTISLVGPGPYAFATGNGGGNGGGEGDIMLSDSAPASPPTESVRVSFTGSRGKDVLLNPVKLHISLMLEQNYLGRPLISYLPAVDESNGQDLDQWIGKLAVRLLLQDFLLNPNKPLEKVVEDNVCVAMFIAFMTVQVKHAR